MNAFEIVQTINLLVMAAREFGLSFEDLAKRQKQAELEGREFGIEDLKAMRDEAKAAIDRLSSRLQ